MTPKTAADWQAEAVAFERAAHREHDRARQWMRRALAAEARLRTYEPDAAE